MMRIYLFFFVSVWFLGCGSGIGRVKAAEEQRAEVIGSIETVGNRNISSAEILSKVRSRVGQSFEPAKAAEDARRIAELKGVEYCYYNTTEVEDKLRLTFVVVERDIVRSVDFVGNREYKANVLRSLVVLKAGDYVDAGLAEADRGGIAEFYRKKGFVFVGVLLDRQALREGGLVYVIEEGPRVKIKSVRFVGNSFMKTEKLKTAVKTREKKNFVLPMYYVEKTATKDAAKLQGYYRKKGFLDCSIALRPEFSEDRSEVEVVFVIAEGPRYVVEEIIFAGNEHFNEERLQAECKLQKGQVYSEGRADSDVKRLLKVYRENGFIDVTVEKNIRFSSVPGAGPEAKDGVSPGVVSIEFEISEGGRFRIGRINITGNEQTQDKVIRRVLDEYGFEPGQWYNGDMARGDGSGSLEKTVKRTALTEVTTITAGGDMPGQRDAQVNIVEGQTGMIMLGAGVASDSGLVGQFVFEQRNFDISDVPDSFRELITGEAFRGAGQSFRIALEPGTEVSQYSVSFSEPYFQNKPVGLDVTGSSWERWRESYDEGRAKGYVGFEKRYKDHWRRSIGFRVENVEVKDLHTDAPQAILDVRGNNFLTGVKFGIGRDLTDDRFNPSRGHVFSAGYEQVGGDHTFGVLSGIHRWYKTVYEDLDDRKTILGTKLYAATVLGDAPAFEKFYAGGQGSIRGFDYRGVSTRGLQTGVGSPRRIDPIGSDWVFLANTELTVPLSSDTFSVLFFVDSGIIDSGPYRVGAGTGIQILIPQWFGPVPMRFELAWPVVKDDDDDTQVFSFSVGRLF